MVRLPNLILFHFPSFCSLISYGSGVGKPFPPGLAIVAQDRFCWGLRPCGLWCLRHRGLVGQTSSSRNQNILLKKQAELKSWTGCREGVVETIPPSMGSLSSGLQLRFYQSRFPPRQVIGQMKSLGPRRASQLFYCVAGS